MFPRSERCREKSVLLSPPVPRCYHQGKMQRRLPAGSPGDVESPGSSGGPDSELSHVRPLPTNHSRGRTSQALPTSRYPHNETCRSAGILLRARTSSRSGLSKGVQARGLASQGFSTSCIICTRLSLMTATMAPSFTNHSNLDTRP